jgi:hypothetical protein
VTVALQTRPHERCDGHHVSDKKAGRPYDARKSPAQGGARRGAFLSAVRGPGESYSDVILRYLPFTVNVSVVPRL